MAISDYSTTAASNTSISGIDISGTTGKVKDGDNAIRQIMADIKAGVPYLSSSQFLFESTDGGTTAAPVLNLYRNSASPAASDILGNITFNGEDSAGNTQEYASIETVIVDATSTSEDGQLDFYVTKAGTRTKFASMTATATAFTGAAGYTFDAVVKPASNDGAALGVSGTAWSDLFLAPGAVVNYNAGDVTWTHSAGAVALGGSAADIVLDLSNAAAGQVKFPATQNPSSNANTLDDYEEGTWTPTITYASGSIGAVTVNSANYTKIGNRVLFDISAQIVTATGSGLLRVTLPVTPVSSAAASGSNNASGGVLSAQIISGDHLYVASSTGGTATTATQLILLGGEYRTA